METTWNMNKKTILALAAELVRGAECMGDDDTELVLEVRMPGTVRDDDGNLNAEPVLAISDAEYPEEGVYPTDPHDPTAGRKQEAQPPALEIPFDHCALELAGLVMSDCGINPRSSEQLKERIAARIDRYVSLAVRHAVEATEANQLPAVVAPTIQLGIYGRAFDTPQTRRAYTYRHQPDNLDAGKLGRAAAGTSSGGDSIDHGLSLLQQLQAQGFGVFELGDQQEGGAA